MFDHELILVCGKTNYDGERHTCINITNKINIDTPTQGILIAYLMSGIFMFTVPYILYQ